jgi:ribosome maturation factor RimP
VARWKWAEAHFFVWVKGCRCSEPGNAVVARDAEHILETVRSVAAPIVQALNVELVDVEWTGQGGRTMIRVFIDKPGGVGLDDCEHVHQSLGHALDVEDPIPHAYVLEVSSPGLDRPLKRHDDYRRSVGKLVNVKLRRPIDGQWRVTGRLVDVREDGVSLNVERTGVRDALRLEWDAIAETRLEIEF